MKPNQKAIREKLEEYAAARGKADNLRNQYEAAIKPYREKFERAAAKVSSNYDAQIAEADAEAKRLSDEIAVEMHKAYVMQHDDYTVKKIETELAVVEVNTSEQREVSPQEWLETVPKSEQKDKFFGTLKVLVTKADGFRSDIVAKLARKKRTHTVSVRLK